jgi:hypothetical protein
MPSSEASLNSVLVDLLHPLGVRERQVGLGDRLAAAGDVGGDAGEQLAVGLGAGEVVGVHRRAGPWGWRRRGCR